MDSSLAEIGIIALVAVILIGIAVYFIAQSRGGYTTTASTTQPTTAPTTVATTTVSRIHSFTLNESEYSITPSAITVPAGSIIVLNIRNIGTVNHDLVVIGSNYSSSPSTPQIAPGSNRTVTFPAPVPGTYSYYCDIANQRELGMIGTLTVT